MLDGFFDIINKIWRYQFFNNEYVNKIFGGAIIVASSWLVLKAVIELIMNYIVKNDGKGSPLVIYRGIVLAIVMMFLVSPLFDFGHNISTALTDDVIKVSQIDSNSSAETTISKAIIRAMVYTDETEKEDITDLVDNWKTISINDTEGGFVGIGDCYKYSLNFFMLIVLSVVTVFLLFFVAIQMAKRVMEIALFKIIGPFCCTSLTNNGRAFETWCKSSMGLFLITVVQFVSIGLMLTMFGSAFQDNGNMTGIFLVIGALLFIIGTPTLVNSLLGQQSGIMSAFGDMQSMIALGHGVNAGLQVAGSGLTSAVSVIPKTAGYGVGLKQQFSSFKENGSSTLGAIGKTALSEMSKPFISAYEKTSNNIKGSFNGARARGSYSPFGLETSNPYKNPYSMKYNPIRNQYTNHNGFDNNGGDN